LTAFYSHSVIDPAPLNDHLERVVCDYCGSDDSRVLDRLPPVNVLLNGAHRLGASALDIGEHCIEFVECRVCGLVYMNPRLTEAAIARFYDTVYSVPSAFPHLDGYTSGRVEYLLDTTARFVKANTPYLLDIGCGGGQFLQAAQARGWSVAGTEISSVAAERASDVLGAPVYVGDFRDAGFAPGSFDVVTMQSLVEHVRLPVDFLREGVALLKPGGVLMFNVPNVASWEYRVARLLGQRWRGFIIEHLYYFTPDFICRLLNDLGLELCLMSSWNPASRFPNPLRDIMHVRQATRAPSVGEPSPTVPPLAGPPPSFIGRVLRQANNYLLDTVSKLSEGRRTSRSLAGNDLFIWAQVP
jgi:2-polyprenyl-3-methyl-5-hydroxy-6-metoxy-1,4-benzoquinol methylase